MSLYLLINMAGNVDVCQQQATSDDDFDLGKALYEMEATLCGTWKLLKNENLDEYLKMIGIQLNLLCLFSYHIQLLFMYIS